MPDTIPEPILTRAAVPSSNGRPVRKDEIELHDRGIYIESWLPERRSRRKPLMFVHGELAGSWVWERFLGYFAGRGWEGHAINLRNHYWSQTADPTTLSFDTYVEDVVAALDRVDAALHLVGIGQFVYSEEHGIRERSFLLSNGPTKSGGQQITLLSPHGLDPAMQRLARELSSQYKVIYGRPQSLIPPERTEVSSAKPGITMRGAPARGESGA
jgi:hypothetical protein